MILVVDFGSQTAHLIGRRLREIGVEVDYAYPEEALEAIKTDKPSGIIFSGGPAGVYEKGAPTISKKIFSLGIPILGICYGWQLMAELLKGQVKSTSKEYGPEKLQTRGKSALLELPKSKFSVYMSHGDTVIKLPPGFTVTATTASVKYAAVANIQQNLFGVQFHPEVTHTEFGIKILDNFAQKICKLKLNPPKIDPNTIVENIKEIVGDQKVICAVSGGVDSTVAAFLIGKAIGKNLIPVYVESGLMRPGTDERVKDIFTKLIKADLRIINAKSRFLKTLKGITDPEKKRKTIGKLYIDIFQEEAKKRQDATFLAQGTIYSDVIESKGSKHASHIKSHHNVGGLPKDIKFELIEPLRAYYKDEVRALGRLAGLPEEVVKQQVFPGPGYAIRIIGAITDERLYKIKIADTIVMDEIKKAGLYDQVYMSFPILTGILSTAVKGDAKAYAEVVALRVIQSDDVMTSDWLYMPKELMQRISSRIVNEVPNVSRVVYDITTKPPATMEWE